MLKILMKKKSIINQHKRKYRIKTFDYSKAFIEYSNNMQDVHKNIDEYDTDKESKILIVFDDMITNMINNNKLNSIVTELFVRSRKLNIFLVFITQSNFKVPKEVRLSTTHFFIMKIPNKREIAIATNCNKSFF